MKHRLLKFIFVINFLFLACVTLADTDSWTSGRAWLVYFSLACLFGYVLRGCGVPVGAPTQTSSLISPPTYCAYHQSAG